jgi:hypothetical protein
MKLPNASRVRVDRSKIEQYLLSHEHPDGSPKARFFERFGFRRSHWEALAAALCGHARTQNVANTVESGYGIRYVLDGPLETPDGRRPYVRTVWIMEAGNDEPRLVTAHPMGRVE